MRLGMAQIQARRASEWIGRLLVHSLARRACNDVPILTVFGIYITAPCWVLPRAVRRTITIGVPLGADPTIPRNEMRLERTLDLEIETVEERCFAAKVASNESPDDCSPAFEAA